MQGQECGRSGRQWVPKCPCSASPYASRKTPTVCQTPSLGPHSVEIGKLTGNGSNKDSGSGKCYKGEIRGLGGGEVTVLSTPFPVRLEAL